MEVELDPSSQVQLNYVMAFIQQQDAWRHHLRGGLNEREAYSIGQFVLSAK